MGSLNLDLTGELQFAGDDFFAPVAADLIDGLIGSYNATRQRLEALAQAVRGAGKTLLPGLKHTWSRVYENEFAGTGVSVALLTLDS